MRVDKRMETIRVLLMMKENENYCKRIGLKDISVYKTSNVSIEDHKITKKEAS